MNYRNMLILIYLKTAKLDYSYTYIQECFGLNFFQIEATLSELVKEGYAEFNKGYIITEKGNLELQKKKLDTVVFWDTFNEDASIFIEKPLDIDEIYIPKKFTKKIKKL